jgi:GNAT superfamily N-acetyltransferase
VFFYRRMVVAEAQSQPAIAASCLSSLRQLPPAPGLWPAGERWQLQTGGKELARAAIWWQHTPPLPGERVGAIGDLAASDDASARVVLEQACRRLAEQGCTRVLAPMDGSTWNAYRCRTGPALGFSGEPAVGPEWVGHLHACGFTVEAHYLCACTDLATVPTGNSDWPARPATLRITDLASLQHQGEAEASSVLVPRIHGLVDAGFRRQPYFQPLPLTAFRAWLEAAQPSAAPELTLLAFDTMASTEADAISDPTDPGVLAGVLLAQRQAQTLVVRTLVVRPGRRWAGLGRMLLAEAHHRARHQNCNRAIHALMLDGGPGHLLSRRTATPCSSYVLMGRALTAPYRQGLVGASS